MNQIKILKTIPLGTTEFTFETRKKFLTYSNGIVHSRSKQVDPTQRRGKPIQTGISKSTNDLEKFTLDL